MKPVRPLLIILLATLAAQARLLTVGPQGEFAKPSQAIAVAANGDTIEIHTAGDYTGDVARISRDNLTLRGVGPGRATLDSKGRVADGKGIWHITGADTVVENIEFIGARSPDHNGAGIRAAGRNLTVRNSRFFDCQDSILNGAGDIVIENCEFDSCGWDARDMAHNLYIGEKVDRLVYRFNVSRRSRHGHLLKSRAKENIIAYNRLMDESDGTGSYVIDLPNGGWTLILANVLQKGPKGDNHVIVAYGLEGVKHARSALYVVNNTFLNEKPNGIFIRGRGWPADMPQFICNNVFAGPAATLTNFGAARMDGNVRGDAHFVDAASLDFRLRPESPAIDAGVPLDPVDGHGLVPEFEFFPGEALRPRIQRGAALDAGAFEAAGSRP